MDKLNEDILATIREVYNFTDEEHEEVLRLYKQSQDDILHFLAELFMMYSVDGLLDYDTYISLYAHDTEKLIVSKAKEMAELETIILATTLESVMNHTYNKTAYNIETNLGVSVNFKLLRKGLIDKVINYNWSGIPFSERIWHNTDSLVRSLRSELAQGLQNGDSINKIAKRIQKQFNSKAYESQRLIRTESARVITESSEQIYEDSGVVEYVQFLATLDNRTSRICQGLDGKKYRLDDESKPKIPENTHPNCRSCYLPIPFDGYEPSARKDNQSKGIIKYRTYERWAKDKGIK